MAFNGSGTFSRLYSWVVDAANGVNISSSRMDAELNGIAAGLSNCVTRDGQSPPSADLPMGGKKLTNLGNATAGTDAVNLTTGDARYVLASGATNLTLTGALNAATGSFSSTLTVAGQANLNSAVVVGTNTFASSLPVYINAASGQVRTFGFLTAGVYAADISLQADNATIRHNAASSHRFDINGAQTFTILGTTVTANANAIINGTGNTIAFKIDDHTNSTSGANLQFVGNGVTTPNKTIRVISGNLEITNSAYNAVLFRLDDSGNVSQVNNITAAGNITAGGVFVGPVLSGASNYNSPSNAGFMGLPQNAQTASYTLTFPDFAKQIYLSGTTAGQTVTIPANASVAFAVGAFVEILNDSNQNWSIAITTDTLQWSPGASTGTRTLAAGGKAVVEKVTATKWWISGTGLS